MFAHLPSDVSRVIADMAIAARNEDRVEHILGTFTTAFCLPTTETDADYFIPVFEGSRDVARVSLVYDGEFSRIGAHRYSVFIDIDTANGTEEYRMFLNDYDGGDADVSLQIVKSLSDPGKYEDLVAEAFGNVFPDGDIYGVFS